MGDKLLERSAEVVDLSERAVHVLVAQHLSADRQASVSALIHGHGSAYQTLGQLTAVPAAAARTSR